MLAPFVAQHVPLIRDYITESPLLCLADPYYPLPVGGDEHWPSVVLLCNFEGADLSTNVVDSSPYGATSALHYTGTEETNARIRTNDKKFGTSSWRHAYAEAGGSTNRMVWFASRAAYAMPGDFTIEFWIKKLAFYSGMFTVLNGATGIQPAYSNVHWNLVARSGAVYGFACAGLYISGALGGEIQMSGATTGVWEHVAFARQGGTIRCFLNGVLKNTATCTGSVSQHDINLFGYRDDGWGLPNGGLQTGEYVDDLRITVGAARYTATFTPPAATFPTGYVPGSTALSMHFNGAVGPAATVDTSSYARTITTVAPAALTTSEKKYGAASGAPGATGYWSAADASELRMGGGDFTAEAWVKAAQPGAGDPLYGNVVALLNLQGSNGSSSFVDQSQYARAYSGVGSPLLTTAQAPTGFASSADLVATNKEIITSAYQAELNLYQTDFCIEGWFMIPALQLSTYSYFCGILGSSLALHAAIVWDSDIDRVRFFNGGGAAGPFLPTAGVWFHYAACYEHSTTTTKLYGNGVLLQSVSNVSYPTNTSAKLWVGRNTNFGGGGNVYAAGVRVTRGSRRYTDNFTPPGAPFLSVGDTALIVGQTDTGMSANEWALAISPSPSKLQLLSGAAGSLLGSTDIPLDSWVHVAASRASGTMRLFQNGVLVASAADATNFSAATGIRVGGGGGTFVSLQGNIDEVRVVKGAASYTAAFTPPAYAYCDSDDGTSDPVPAPPETPTQSPLRFQAIEVECLDATESAALGSTVIANIDTDSNGPDVVFTNVPPGLTPVFTWIGPLTGTLAVAGTPTAPGTYRLTATFYEHLTLKALGTTECDVTIWPAAGTFTVGVMSSPSLIEKMPAGDGGALLASPSANYNVDVSVVANRSVPGMTLLAAWTPGATSSGTVRLIGTPNKAGSYAITLTYRRISTCEIRDLATSTHTVLVTALVAPPAPAPAPSPAPAPAPAPAPTPPGISLGPVPDTFTSSVAILQQWNNSRIVMYEVGDSRVDFVAWYMDATGRHEMQDPGVSGEGAGDAGSNSSLSYCFVGDSRWQTDGNMTADCFYRMSAADLAYLFGASTETRLLCVMSLNSTASTGNFMWKLGYSSSLEGGRRVVRPTFMQGRVGGPSGSSPIQAFGPEIAPPPYAFFHLAGQVVLSGATTEIAAWHNGVGGGATKIVTSGQSYRLVSGNTFQTHDNAGRPNCSPTGGLKYPGAKSPTGNLDQIRVTKAQRYTATAGVTNAIERAKITPPFLL
jgi:hypothetical protein